MQHSHGNSDLWQDTVAVTATDGAALLDQAEIEDREPIPPIELDAPRVPTLRLAPRLQPVVPRSLD
jgi:hypothetical protein